MSVPFTRRLLRDKIRRKLGRVPAIDAGIGPSGDPGPNDSKMSNQLLNDCIEETISDLNVLCGISGPTGPITKHVLPQTANGPLTIDLSRDFSPRDSQINAINRVWWSVGGVNTVLTPTHYRWLDANMVDFYSIPPSIPNQYWVEGYNLWILPAPMLEGDINCFADSALHSPLTDDDTIAQLPGDLNWVVVDGAALRVCGTQPYDRVMAANAALLKESYAMGIERTKRVLGMMNGEYQPGFVPVQYRQRRGAR